MITVEAASRAVVLALPSKSSWGKCEDMDQSSNVVLFRVPEKVSLTTPYSEETNLHTLPHDVLLVIFESLDLGDRICVGLTCKRLAFQVTLSPRIPAEYKTQATYPLTYDVVNEFYQPRQSRPLYVSFTSDWYTLLPRLANGWMPKDKFKHCWKCNKIFPKDEKFYERAVSKAKAPGWLWKLNVTEKQWTRMSVAARHKHIITRWLGDDSTVNKDLHSAPASHNFYCPDLDVWTTCKINERGLECPLCLERELTCAYYGPRKVPRARYPTSSRNLLTSLIRLPVDVALVAVITISSWIRASQ